ncbi:tyrosine-type recombinase/integrase [uncultured Dubosiella sp.]|uniref:tyrosine-type recombinase/integrase n=1 Tax=uncultured Dubosiella sp. TaxID=1937011 RepID=UPI002730D377|nr:tyrosine-type recombinase/integrase [uncultured Dubosiella sp.]
MERDIDDGIDFKKKQITIYEMLDRYFKTRKFRRNSEDYAYKIMKSMGRYDFAYRKIEDVTESDCRKFILEINQDYYDSRVEHTVVAISGAYKLAIKDGLARKNPFDFKWRDLLAGKVKEKAPLTSDQMERLLNFMRNDTCSAFYVDRVIFLVETGLRISEFLGLAVEDFDFERRTVQIRRQLLHHDRTYYLASAKTPASEATIALSPKAVQSAKNIMEQCGETYPMTDEKGKLYHLFVLSKGHKLTNECAINIAFSKVCKRYNTVHPDDHIYFTPHILRHTAATRMIKDGVKLPVVRKMIRHKSIDTTIRRYVTINPDDIVQEIESIYK